MLGFDGLVNDSVDFVSLPLLILAVALSHFPDLELSGSVIECKKENVLKSFLSISGFRLYAWNKPRW